jgi:hypothetical protein
MSNQEVLLTTMSCFYGVCCFTTLYSQKRTGFAGVSVRRAEGGGGVACSEFYKTLRVHLVNWKTEKLLGLTKSQRSVKTSFGKEVCELKAIELDFPRSVPKAGLYRQGIKAVSINLKPLVIKVPTRVVLTRIVPTRVVLT